MAQNSKIPGKAGWSDRHGDKIISAIEMIKKIIKWLAIGIGIYILMALFWAILKTCFDITKFVSGSNAIACIGCIVFTILAACGFRLKKAPSNHETPVLSEKEKYLKSIANLRRKGGKGGPPTNIHDVDPRW